MGNLVFYQTHTSLSKARRKKLSSSFNTDFTRFLAVFITSVLSIRRRVSGRRVDGRSFIGRRVVQTRRYDRIHSWRYRTFKTRKIRLLTALVAPQFRTQRGLIEIDTTPNNFEECQWENAVVFFIFRRFQPYRRKVIKTNIETS